MVLFDIDAPDAPPDTLWQGDTSGGGLLVEGGRSAVVRDADNRLFWVTPFDGRSLELGLSPEGALLTADFNPRLGLLAVGGWWDTIQVFEVDTGRAWTIPALRKGTWLQFDPLGRWLISRDVESEVCAWRLPLDPLFEELEYPDLLRRVRDLTNVRMVRDDDSQEGFRVTTVQDQP
jgi:hypothetical protein